MIATKPEEITENTVVYIGNLLIEDKILPTYNLKYIYGDLNYIYPGKIQYLENLYKVFGVIRIKNVINLEGLDSLEVLDSIYIGDTDSILGIENIPVRTINIENIKNVENIILPSTLKYFTFFISNDNINTTYSNIDLSINNNYLHSLKFVNETELNNFVFPKCVDLLQLRKMITIKNVTFPEKVEILDLYDAKEIINISLPLICDEICMDNVEYINDLCFPKELRALSLSSLKRANNLILPKNIEYDIDLLSLESFDGIYVPKRIMHKIKSLIPIPDECTVYDNEYDELVNQIYNKDEKIKVLSK